MKWYLKVVKDNYANFKGRASREEYWMFILFNIIFIFAITFIEAFLCGSGQNRTADTRIFSHYVVYLYNSSISNHIRI